MKSATHIALHGAWSNGWQGCGMIPFRLEEWYEGRLLQISPYSLRILHWNFTCVKIHLHRCTFIHGEVLKLHFKSRNDFRNQCLIIFYNLPFKSDFMDGKRWKADDKRSGRCKRWYGALSCRRWTLLINILYLLVVIASCNFCSSEAQ